MVVGTIRGYSSLGELEDAWTQQDVFKMSANQMSLFDEERTQVLQLLNILLRVYWILLKVKSATIYYSE
jgi:hypothetical protein